MARPLAHGRVIHLSPQLFCLPCKPERSHVQMMANPPWHHTRVSCDGAADGPGLLIRVGYRSSRKQYCKCVWS